MADHNVGSQNVFTPQFLVSSCRSIQGARIFQSLSVLGSLDPWTSAPAHDYLESTTWSPSSIFWHISSCSTNPTAVACPVRSGDLPLSIVGTRFSPVVPTRRKSSCSEQGGRGTVLSNLSRQPGDPRVVFLFAKFRYWTYTMWDDKACFVRIRKRGKELDSLGTLLSKSEEHYAEVLKMFDDAIQGAEASLYTHSEPASPLPSGSVVLSDEKNEPSADCSTIQTTPVLN